VTLALALFGVTNLPWHLDDYDQAKQAFTSFEMVESGHWLYQHTPNRWAATKPPLVGWISAAVYGITRSWELAWRLPSFLAAIGLLVLVTRAAGSYGAVASLIAASAFSLNLLTPRLASLVRTDMPLALVLFGAGLVIWNKARERTRWTSRDQLILFALLSAGMLIKGPIVYAFLLPGVVAVEWLSRRRRVANPAWSGWLPWLLSFLVFLIWVGGGILFVPDFTEHVVLREFAGRFSDEVHRSQPFYYYLPHLLHRFAPWSLLLIGLAFLTRKPEEGSSAPRTAGLSLPTFWLLAWSIGGLIVMSCVPSKRIDRIFPIIPPLCLLLGVLATDARGRFGRAVDRLCVIALGLAVLGTTAYTVQKTIAAQREQRDAFAVFGRAVVREVAAHQWRYALVGRDDEGLALYVRRIEFLNPYQGVAEWNAGRVDALVVPEDDLPKILPLLNPPEPTRALTSGQAGRYRRRYVLLAKRSSA
jgi:4-amino-4-deoxy-L-arabinose transferase-like glycosyltransferase